MTFEEWLKEMKPAECDELKDEFVDCWNTAIEECAQRAEAYAYMSPNFTALSEELRSMKVKP